MNGIDARSERPTAVTVGALHLLATAAGVLALGLAGSPIGVESGPAASHEAAGAALLAVAKYAWTAGEAIVCVGAAILSWLLLRSGRVPRWPAIWGLVAAPLMLAAMVLPLTGDPGSTVSTVLNAPTAMQEMVLAVWLIGWGFRSAARPRPHHDEGSASWTPSLVS